SCRGSVRIGSSRCANESPSTARCWTRLFGTATAASSAATYTAFTRIRAKMIPQVRRDIAASDHLVPRRGGRAATRTTPRLAGFGTGANARSAWRGREASMSLTRFAGRVAIVTGAGSGLGRATAKALASEGAAVACLDVVAEAAERTAAEIASDGGRGRAERVDVADPASARAAVSASA